EIVSSYVSNQNFVAVDFGGLEQEFTGRSEDLVTLKEPVAVIVSLEVVDIDVCGGPEVLMLPGAASQKALYGSVARQASQRIGIAEGRPAQQGLNVSNEVFERERFWNVIIGPGGQYLDFAFLVGAGGQHDDGQVSNNRSLAHLSEDSQAVQPG